MARSWDVSTFCDTLPMDFLSSPKRFVPGIRSRRISTFHLSPIKVSVVSTGQAGNSFFPVFSLIYNSGSGQPPNSFHLVTSALISAYFTKMTYGVIIL